MRFPRGDVRTAIIALVVAGAAASAPAIAHGVHARFAHRSAKARTAARLGGVPAAKYQRSCNPGAVLASVTLNPFALRPTFSTTGVQTHFSCYGRVTAKRVGTGTYYVRFGNARCGNTCRGPAAVVTPRTANNTYCTYEGRPTGDRPDIAVYCNDLSGAFTDSTATFALLSRPG